MYSHVLLGITNQRETTVAWSRKTGKSLCRAIVWDDNRVKNLVVHFENQAKTKGVEYEGQLYTGEEGLKALRKLLVHHPWNFSITRVTSYNSFP